MWWNKVIRVKSGCNEPSKYRMGGNSVLVSEHELLSAVASGGQWACGLVGCLADTSQA